MPEQKIDPEAVRRLYAEHRSTRKVAKILGVSQPGIMDCMIRYNIPRFSTSDAMVGKSAEWNKTIDIEKAKELYTAGQSTNFIAQELGYSQYGVWNALKRAGIQMRSPGARSGYEHWKNSNYQRSIDAFGFELTEEWCRQAMNAFGGNATAVAKHYGFKYVSFVDRLKRYGIPRLDAPIRRIRVAPFNIDEAKSLSDSGITYEDLAKKYGVSYSVIMYHLSRVGYKSPRDKHTVYDAPKSLPTIKRKMFQKFFDAGIKGCMICDESRALELCHIQPKRDGGLLEEENLLILCQTHSHLFDFPTADKSLTREEFDKVKQRIRDAETLYNFSYPHYQGW